MSWRDRALCLGEYPETWFPAHYTKDGREHPDVTAAKSVCLHCPVAAECATHALTHGEDGIWGGLTPDERRALSRRKPPPTITADCGTYNGYKRHKRAGENACTPCKAANAAYERDRSTARRDAAS